MDWGEERQAIGRRIAEALRGKDLTQTALAKRLGAGKSTVTGWIQGRTQPDLVVVAQICAILGCHTDWLLGLEGARRSFPEAQAEGLRVESRCPSCGAVLVVRIAKK